MHELKFFLFLYIGDTATYINLVCIATQYLHTTVVPCSSTDELVTISATSKPIVHVVALLYMHVHSLQSLEKTCLKLLCILDERRGEGDVLLHVEMVSCSATVVPRLIQIS